MERPKYEKNLLHEMISVWGPAEGLGLFLAAREGAVAAGRYNDQWVAAVRLMVAAKGGRR